ncbi:MAG: class I SAM-dependent methyltransferase [Sphingobium sp.]|nr:class I SAM-dependent methyltransferase [Sphingobium sp.]
MHALVDIDKVEVRSGTGKQRDAALLALLDHLTTNGYDFVTPTPATQARVLERWKGRTGRSVRDVLGWSLPFVSGAVDTNIEELLWQAGVLVEEEGRLRSRIRVSRLKRQLFIHSAYPTSAEDAVFFGPDSYRFSDLIEGELQRLPCAPGSRILDIGTGSGVGAIIASRLATDAEVFGTDINRHALSIARINARAAGVDLHLVEGSNLADVQGAFDLILANPPYIIDPSKRAYRDGGGMHGGEVAVDMARAALPRLSEAGRFILYTGSAIAEGRDSLRAALQDAAGEYGCDLSYRELDPDVFGEELEQPAYADVERIAVVAAIFSDRASHA